MAIQKQEIFMTKFLISIASLVIVIAGMKLSSTVLIPVTFSIFLALFGLALLKGFQKIKIPKFLAIIIVMTFIVLSFIFCIDLLKSSIIEFNETIPQYKTRLDEITKTSTSFLKNHGISIQENKISEMFTIEKMMDVFLKSLKGIMGAVSNTILVLVLVLFILFEATSFQRKLDVAFKNSSKFGRFSKTSNEIQTYIFIKSITSAITGILVYFFVLFFDLDFPVLWGMSSFLFNYIPIIGSIVAAIPAILLAVIQLGFTDAGIIAIGYIVINWGVSYFIEPLLMGKNLGLSPLMVLLSVFFWGWLWGSAGMLLSIPLTMVIKILFENSKDFYWVGVLMGDGLDLKSKEKEEKQ